MEILAGVIDVAFRAAAHPFVFKLLAAVLVASVVGWLGYLIGAVTRRRSTHSPPHHPYFFPCACAFEITSHVAGGTS